MLSDVEILREMEIGNIFISPFDEANLGPNSYDVRIGEWYYSEVPTNGRRKFYNPWTMSPARVWGERIHATKSIILEPGQNILAHTEEFIGGRNIIAAEMHARSSIGRNFLTVCRCAGFGDVGYINRWTMEITNNSRYYSIEIPVGMRIAQMQFSRMERSPTYPYQGKYQDFYKSEEEMIQGWHPESMLPRLDRDREMK